MAIDNMLTIVSHDPLPHPYNRGSMVAEDRPNRDSFLKSFQKDTQESNPQDLSTKVHLDKKSQTDGYLNTKQKTPVEEKTPQESTLQAPISLQINSDQNVLEGIEQLYPGGIEEFFANTWVGLQDGEAVIQPTTLIIDPKDLVTLAESFDKTTEVMKNPIQIKSPEQSVETKTEDWLYEEIFSDYQLIGTRETLHPEHASINTNTDEITLSSYGNIVVEGFDGEVTDFEKMKLSQNLIQTLPPFQAQEKTIEPQMATIVLDPKVSKEQRPIAIDSASQMESKEPLTAASILTPTTENKPDTGMFDGQMKDPFFELKSTIVKGDGVQNSDENFNPLQNETNVELENQESSSLAKANSLSDTTSVKSNPVTLTLADTVKSHPLFFAHRGHQVHTPAPQSQHLFIEVRKALDEGQDKITVKLSPVSLGKVDIKIEVGPDGRSTAIIATERPETLDLFRKDATYLQNSLSEIGLELDLGESSFSLMNPYENKNQQQSQDSGKGPGSKTQDDFGDVLVENTNIYQRVSSHNGLYHEFA